MAVHTQYVFLKKNKRKNIHVAFQNEEKILYFFVVAGVIEKFRPGRVWFLQMGGGSAFQLICGKIYLSLFFQFINSEIEVTWCFFFP